jgi:hypothetical protein
VLSLSLDNICRRLAESGSADVLQGANELAVASTQRAEAQTYYSRFSEIAASGIFGLVILGLIGLINPPLFSVLIGLILLQVAITALVLRFGNPISPGPTQRFVKRKLGTYLGILVSINFLAGFFVMLAPFVLSGNGNILVAILCILMLRWSQGAISGAISDGVDLFRKQLLINPLVFREHRQQKKEKLESRAVRELFGKDARRRIALRELANVANDDQVPESEWRDSTINGVYTFAISRRQPSDPELSWFQQQVFPVKQLHLLEHEEFLFNHLDREELKAPRVYSRFREGPFECQICEYGIGEPLSALDWREFTPDLVALYWSSAPPRPLINAFNTSKSTLEGRLTREFIERVSVALDTTEERELFDTFVSRLSIVRAVLGRIPVYIYNPDFTRHNLVKMRDDDVRVMTWGRWSLEPIGAALPKAIRGKELEDVLEKVRKIRKLDQNVLSEAHINLAYECREMERDIGRSNFKVVLQRISRVLANNLVADDVE